MAITLNGSTGITSPEVTLDNTSADGGQVVLKSSGYDNWNLDNYSGRLRAYNGSTERMTIDTNGNVGIGTSSPSSGLEIKGTGSFPKLTLSDTSLAASATVSCNDGDLILTADSGSAVSDTSMLFYVDATERGRFDASGNFKFNSGYGSVATAYGCRAWVNFNGTGTVAIRSSGNVSSITDNGTGTYTVNLANAMPDANYAISVAAGQGSGSGAEYWVSAPFNTAPTTTEFAVEVVQVNAVADAAYVHAAIFR